MSRLDSRRHDGEDRNDVIRRLLDETIEEVSIETVVGDIFEYFDHVACIDVAIKRPERPTSLRFTVFTGDVYGYEEDVSLHDSGRKRVAVETSDGERFVVPFFIVATSDGPSYETISRTPLYYSDNIVGTDPMDVDEGLDRLRSKLGKSVDEIREMLPRDW